jgi:FlaA1/EpsC-like NDP-sugar epimerase
MGTRIGFVYENIGKLDYLFPFKNVKKGERIIIYGMGKYGQMLYEFVQNTGFCELVACADQNYEKLSTEGFENIISPDEIANYSYDAIVISCSKEKIRKAIYNDLALKYLPEKIHMVDKDILRSEVGLRAFGFID